MLIVKRVPPFYLPWHRVVHSFNFNMKQYPEVKINGGDLLSEVYVISGGRRTEIQEKK